jgi:hypothetical protein
MTPEIKHARPNNPPALLPMEAAMANNEDATTRIAPEMVFIPAYHGFALGIPGTPYLIVDVSAVSR